MPGGQSPHGTPSPAGPEGLGRSGVSWQGAWCPMAQERVMPPYGGNKEGNPYQVRIEVVEKRRERCPACPLLAESSAFFSLFSNPSLHTNAVGKQGWAAIGESALRVPIPVFVCFKEPPAFGTGGRRARVGPTSVHRTSPLVDGCGVPNQAHRTLRRAGSPRGAS